MPLSPRKHDKLNHPKHAAVTLDSFLGLLSSAYGTEQLDSSIIFDEESVNWNNISVENLRAIPKKEDISDKVRNEKATENVKLNAATSTTSLKPSKISDGETDETLYSIRSLVNIQKIKSKTDNSGSNESTANQLSKLESQENITKQIPADQETPENQIMDPKEEIENDIIPVCGFYVDDCDHKVVFDIQFVKKNTPKDDIMPMFEIGEPEVLMNIYDTLKPMKTNVKVAKCNLVSKVQYFAEVDKEFGLQNLDVIIKCNLGVFQWVVQWIASDIPMCKPNLNLTNLKAILPMANHLGINQLVEECLDFFRQNFNGVLDSDSDIENVLDEKLLLDLTKRFTNSEVNQINDKYESIKSKLFCTLIKMLADPDPCNRVGHFSSLSTMFQCGFCEKIMHDNLEKAIPCRTECTQLTFQGNLDFHHECSSFWNLSKLIEEMYDALQDWRLVYWQLWGMCHFCYCEVCEAWYPMSQSEWCPYHPGQAEYFLLKKDLYHPIGTFGCCGEKTFKFNTLKPYGGCRYKGHVSKLDTMEKVEVFNIHQECKLLINCPVSEDLKIRKFVKLIKKTDECSVLQDETPRERFWWRGILLAPEVKEDYSLIPFKVFNILRNRPEEKKVTKTHLPLKYGKQIPFGNIIPCKDKIAPEIDSKEQFTSKTQLNKRSKPKLAVKKGKSSTITLGAKQKNKKKKLPTFVYQPMDSVWTDLESNKDNADNQRDFEEIAMRKLVKMLTPTDNTGSLHGSSAGSYIRLETEWWQRNCASNMDKTSSTVVNRTFPLSWFRRLTI